MNINYAFSKTIDNSKTDNIVCIQTKIPFYLITKFFNSNSDLNKLIYNKSFIFDICIPDNPLKETDFKIDYDQTSCSENIIRDSNEMNKALRKAYISASLSEKLCDEFNSSDEFRKNIMTISNDMELDTPINLNSQYGIGVYESICKQGLKFFEDKNDVEKINFYQKLLKDLDIFTVKCIDLIKYQLPYLVYGLSDMPINISIQNFSVYLTMIKKTNVEYDKIQDMFEREFIRQYIEYINSLELV